jgi:hypothetical protein
MDFDNSPIPASPLSTVLDSTEIAGRLPLLEWTITDSKTIKRMHAIPEKLHHETNQLFYSKGVWSKSVSMDTDRRRVEVVSSVRYPLASLFKYRVHLELLPNYSVEDPDNFFFTLTYKNIKLKDFTKSIDAKYPVTMVYYYGSKNAILTNGTTRFELPVEFSYESPNLSVPEELMSDELHPVVCAISDKFQTIADSLTKVKKQSTFDFYIDFQVDQCSGDFSSLIHSSEKSFSDKFGDYNSEREHDFRFTIKYAIMRALSLLPKVNENGFISFSFINEDVLKVSTQVGNFATYDVFVVVN